MARNRDYQAEYQRRSERAASEGFSGYGEKRHALEYARSSEHYQTYYPGDYSPDKVKAFYNAFGKKENANDYSTSGAKAFWFVEMEDLMNYEDWETLYG